MHNIKYNPISQAELKSILKIEDLSVQTKENNHAIKLILEDLLTALSKLQKNLDIEVVKLSPIVKLADNFDRLRFSKDNPGRSSTYTKYLDRETVLRTHTSAMIPPTLDRLSKTDFKDKLLVLPGLVYRRDVTDKTHAGVFHHGDVWRITKNKQYSKQDLLDLVGILFKTLMPNYEPIIYETEHPYTLNGIEVYAKVGEKEIEILEAGLIHPEILSGSGLNPNNYSGLALGSGLERILMVRKNLPDIRLIRSTDPRIKSQMENLDIYKPVSLMPAVSRDMSYSVPNDYTEEDIHEDLRLSLNENVKILEEVIIISQTNYQDLQEVARQKLGIKPNQKNILVRLILRDLDRTLTKEYANQLMDNIYKQVNQSGTLGYSG